MDYIWHADSPLGGITLASCGEALSGLWFDGQKHFAAALGTAREEKPLPVFIETASWLEAYFAGKVPDFTPPLRLKGTTFQKAVWELLLTIPYGETRSYGELAAQLAEAYGLSRVSARAVGAAVGRNPISIIVPCHRVLGANGRLTGYAGGLARKRALLTLEGARFSLD